MEVDYGLKRFQLNDISKLRKTGLLCGKKSDLEEEYRHKLNARNLKLYIVIGNDEEYLGLFSITFSSNSKYNCELNIILTQDFKTRDLIDAVFTLSLREIFVKYLMHKVSITIRSDDELLESAAMDFGFTQEAILYDEYSDEEGRYIDGGLFYLLLPEYKANNVTFVPFQRGIVAIYGNEEVVSKVSFYKYEQKIEDRFTSEVAQYIGFADSKGVFLARNNECYKCEDSHAPKELSKAADQLREFFLKRRETFDINLDYSSGTDFQQKVWKLLLDVPYGFVISYEDLALKLTDRREDAKNLTRAVGSACSDNPIPIFIPCHRVIGKNGKLVGYSGGIEFKDFLLQLESIFTTVL